MLAIDRMQFASVSLYIDHGLHVVPDYSILLALAASEYTDSKFDRMSRLLVGRGADLEFRVKPEEVCWLSYFSNGSIFTTGSALFAAASKANVSAVRTLLELGADIRSRDTKGKTPLMEALAGKKRCERDPIRHAQYLEVIALLASAGVDIHA